MSVIFLVADGTSFAQYSVLFQNPMGRKIFKDFKYSLLVNTTPPQRNSKLESKYGCVPTNKLNPVTESASSASAMSTGKWHQPGAISSTLTGRKYTSIVEQVKTQRKKYKFGIVCSTSFFDATPSAFYAHSKNRYNKDSLTEQILSFGLDVLVSGGTKMKQLIKTKADNLPPFSKLINTNEYVGKDRTTKNVSKHLDKALKHFEQNPFFLVVEESMIDIACHQNKIKQMACELTSLMNTVQVAIKFAHDPKNKTTLILVSDHGTGAAVVENTANETSSHFKFHSENHDGHIVPLFITGYRCKQAIEFLDSGLIDMIDVNKLLKFLLKIK